MQEQLKIISVREQPQYLERAIDYFASKFYARRLYDECIRYSLTTDNPLPRWYLYVDEGNDRIIGCAGLITSDFNSRQDLYPWFSALYIEEDCRGRQLGSHLMQHIRRAAGAAGFRKIYLSTDHIGYYERYGWEFLTICQNVFEHDPTSRVYVQDTIAE